MASELKEKLRALRPQLEAVADELDKLGDVQERTKAAQAALKEIQSQRDAAKKEHDQEVAGRKREIADLDKAKSKAGTDLKAWQDRIGAAEEEAKTLDAENNSRRQYHDRILASLESLRKQVAAA
jgi:chromosome segregation ATPase